LLGSRLIMSILAGSPSIISPESLEGSVMLCRLLDAFQRKTDPLLAVGHFYLRKREIG